MSGLIWVGVLLLLSLAVLVLEMFIPSGGILGIVSAIGFLASIVMAFRESSELGLAYLVGLAIGLPFVLWGMIKYWPHTAIGRMMLNMPPPGTKIEPTHNPLEDLIGKKGLAKSKMLPSGAVVIDGRTYDAVADGIAVELGACVEVSRVEGSRITVRACSPDAPAVSVSSSDQDQTGVDRKAADQKEVDHAASDPSAANSQSEPSGQGENVLDRTYDDVIEDPFDENT